mmetsp:Transcript_10804/g.26683  ORF Transcript_10804/g.26683 Transcript_10804/m.26683 type:complete len:212 (-) Transcript_10804:1020-1655(-)
MTGHESLISHTYAHPPSGGVSTITPSLPGGATITMTTSITSAREGSGAAVLFEEVESVGLAASSSPLLLRDDLFLSREHRPLGGEGAFEAELDSMRFALAYDPLLLLPEELLDSRSPPPAPLSSPNCLMLDAGPLPTGSIYCAPLRARFRWYATNTIAAMITTAPHKLPMTAYRIVLPFPPSSSSSSGSATTAGVGVGGFTLTEPTDVMSA